MTGNAWKEFDAGSECVGGASGSRPAAHGNGAMRHERRIPHRSGSKGGKMKNTSIRTGKMVRLAILAAIIIVMSLTPLGYLKVGTIEITFMMIPVAIAAIIVGPVGGAIAGGIFGLTSFYQCFGASPFGVVLFGINPFYTFILCVIPRILAGWLPGLLFSAVSRIWKNKTASVTAASFAAPVLNTVFFVGTLFLLFGSDDFIKGFGDTTWAIIVLLVGVNGLIEAGVGIVAGSAVSRALIYFIPEKKREI